jgi:hypothetical protein
VATRPQNPKLLPTIVRTSTTNIYFPYFHVQSRILTTIVVLLLALLKAWAFSWHPQAVPRAEEIIQQMESSSREKPDFRSYTTLITCYGRSKEPGAPQKAEKVLRRMDELFKNGILREGPTHRTFLSLRKAWEISYEPDKEDAIQAINHEMMTRFPNEARGK